jgi:hypothetical protein
MLGVGKNSTSKSWGVTLRGAATSSPYTASKSMMATLALYPSVPTCAMNILAAMESSRQKESWNCFLIALKFKF